MRFSADGFVDVRDLLGSAAITASAPCRVNCGGTLDVPALAVPLEGLEPATVNIALAMRAEVTLLSHEPGELLVSCPELGADRQYECRSADFGSDFGLVAAIAYYFRLQGLHIHIRTQFPSQSGLGGSGAVAVATTAACEALRPRLGNKRLSRTAIVGLAYAIEHSLGAGTSGMQDHAAAAFGGANLWRWQYTVPGRPFRRRTLVKREDVPLLQRHLLVGYTGLRHRSDDQNARWVAHFRAGAMRERWTAIVENTRRFGSALARLDWEQAARLLMRETEIRLAIAPDAFPRSVAPLLAAAADLSCGVRFAGAGGGGCVWAIGASSRIRELRAAWRPMLAAIGGRLLPCVPDTVGVSVRRCTGEDWARYRAHTH